MTQQRPEEPAARRPGRRGAPDRDQLCPPDGDRRGDPRRGRHQCGNQVRCDIRSSLTFPSVMSLVNFDFPFATNRSVHTEPSQYRPIAVTDAVGVRVRGESARTREPAGLVTSVSVGNVSPGTR